MSKLILSISIAVFGGIGSYLPVWFFGVSPFSGWSILAGTVGSIVGIWVWVRYRDYL